MICLGNSFPESNNLWKWFIVSNSPLQVHSFEEASIIRSTYIHVPIYALTPIRATGRSNNIFPSPYYVITRHEPSWLDWWGTCRYWLLSCSSIVLNACVRQNVLCVRMYIAQERAYQPTMFPVVNFCAVSAASSLLLAIVKPLEKRLSFSHSVRWLLDWLCELRKAQAGSQHDRFEQSRPSVSTRCV